MIEDETKEYYDDGLTFSLELASKFTAMKRIKQELVELVITDERTNWHHLESYKKGCFLSRDCGMIVGRNTCKFGRSGGDAASSLLSDQLSSQVRKRVARTSWSLELLTIRA